MGLNERVDRFAGFEMIIWTIINVLMNLGISLRRLSGRSVEESDA